LTPFRVKRGGKHREPVSGKSEEIFEKEDSWGGKKRWSRIKAIVHKGKRRKSESPATWSY